MVITYSKQLSWSRVFYENVINIANVSWENFKPFWRLQNYWSREEDVHVHSPSIYGRIVKWKKTINEMGGNIPCGNFLSGNFPRGNLVGGNFAAGNFPGGNFPKTVWNNVFWYVKVYIFWQFIQYTIPKNLPGDELSKLIKSKFWVRHFFSIVTFK